MSSVSPAVPSCQSVTDREVVKVRDEDCVGELGQIALPSLVIAGEDTTAPYRRVAEILNERIVGSDLQTIPEGGHMTPLTHPDQIARAIRTQCLSV